MSCSFNLSISKLMGSWFLGLYTGGGSTSIKLSVLLGEWLLLLLNLRWSRFTATLVVSNSCDLLSPGITFRANSPLSMSRNISLSSCDSSELIVDWVSSGTCCGKNWPFERFSEGNILKGGGDMFRSGGTNFWGFFLPPGLVGDFVGERCPVLFLLLLLFLALLTRWCSPTMSSRMYPSTFCWFAWCNVCKSVNST